MSPEMIELGLHIAETGNSGLKRSYNRLAESAVRRHRVLSLVQEALSQLSLDIHYLVFDLDATRRERDELRERFGES